jgi:ABC-type multidrug transport system ATPase subunit
MAIMNNGQIVFNGSPDEGINSLKGKVYEKQIARSELDSYKKEYNVISNKLIGGKPVIHILGEKNPDKTFKKIEPSLEDVFFTNIQE